MSFSVVSILFLVMLISFSLRIHFLSFLAQIVISTFKGKKLLTMQSRRTVALCTFFLPLVISYVSNTPNSFELFSRAWEIYAKHPETRHQVALSTAISEQLKANRLRVHLLPISQFSPGWYFFEEQHRISLRDLPCDECVMFHNNWIVSASAKIYRLKELGLFYTELPYYDADVRYLAYQPLSASATLGLCALNFSCR